MCKSTLCQGSAAHSPQTGVADFSAPNFEARANEARANEPRVAMALDFHDQPVAPASAIAAKIAAIPVHAAPAALSEAQRSCGRCSSCERQAGEEGQAAA